MRIITGANKEYKELYNKVKEDAKAFGYKFGGYDYGDLGEGKKISVGIKNPTEYGQYVGKIPGKPLMLLSALKDYDEFLVYVDADVRIKQPIDEVVGDYDIGVTSNDKRFHTGKEKYLYITGFLNAGVVFINNTEKAKEFVKEWNEEIQYTTTNSDQEALTNILRRGIKDWDITDHEINGVKVRLFPSPVYNYTGIRGECDNPKIVHFIGTLKDKLLNGVLN